MSYKIAVDAMGGDYAPIEIIKGAIKAMQEEKDLQVVFVGNESTIRKELEANGWNGHTEIVHTEQFIEMDASPKKALNEKPQASISVATRLVHSGQAHALVSAGNTGATVLACAQNLQMIEGLERSALAAVYPTAKFIPGSRGYSLLLDVGATIRCTAKQLVHFALMGHYYASQVLGIDSPKIGLLNNGEEESKGGPVLTQAYRYLKESKKVNFVGNVEGKDIPKGTVDVIVTEGFVGNVVLKLMEGVAEVVKDTGKYAFEKKVSWKIGLALLSSGIKKLKHKTDYSEYGGAPILGFDKLVIKAHGRSNAKAISNAIKVAVQSVKQDVVNSITSAVHQFNEAHQIDLIEI